MNYFIKLLNVFIFNIICEICAYILLKSDILNYAFLEVFLLLFKKLMQKELVKCVKFE